MTKGRIPDVRMASGALTDVLTPHIVMPLDAVAIYSQLRMRRRGRWAELFRNRSVCHDVMVATDGHSLSQGYVESELTIIVRQMMKITPPTELPKDTTKSIEKLGYRLRAMMSHLRSAKRDNLQPTKRFAALKALIAMASTDAPPADRVDNTSVVATTADDSSTLMVAACPGPFVASPVDDDCLVVAPSAVDLQLIDVLSSSDEEDFH